MPEWTMWNRKFKQKKKEDPKKNSLDMKPLSDAVCWPLDADVLVVRR